MADAEVLKTQESRRLAALARYRVLDTPRERGFDDLAALASVICGTPIAVVNLIGSDRQWFKAEVGLGVDETPLETSFCGMAILEEDFLLVPDATQDERFACNPLVTAEAGLRFYAGAILKSPDGFPIGTLCVLDHEPRSLDDRQQQALCQLARQVMVQLELRLALIEREEAYDELERRIAQRAYDRSRTWQLTPDLMGVLNDDGIFESSNPAWQATLGLSEERISTTPIFELMHPDDVARSLDAFAEVQSGTPVLRFENRYLHADGAYRWLSWVVVPEDGKYYATAREITAEKARAEELARAQAERDRAWSLSQDLLAIADKDRTLIAVNAAWTMLLGFEEDELVGRAFAELTHPDDLEATIVAFAGIFDAPLITPYEYRLRHKDGHYCWFAWTGSFRDGRVYATGRDTTAQRLQADALASAEDALRQSQKLEAIGQLTGGVAHDFNNLLTVIRGSVDLLRRDDLSEAKRARYIDAIGDTADRAARLTGQLLAFARRQALSADLFDAGTSLEEVATMLQTMTGSRIVLELNVPAEPYFIVADRSQFDTAIVNIGINARDAMGGEGRLTIATGPVSGIPPIRGHAAVAGDFIAVTIADTGAGIAADQLDHIFEPFFTTKRVGEGTGLGLSQVIGFAKQSGGDVRVDSVPGEGTTFTLYLPRAYSDQEAHPEEQEDQAPVTGEGTCVLVVEDNEQVGRFATAALTELGYQSELATDAVQALAALASGDGRFHIVFSDVVMPGMGGVELGQEIRRLHPDVPVILTSGYSHVLAENGRHGFELLHKPYSIEQLSRVLRKAAAWQSARRSQAG